MTHDAFNNKLALETSAAGLGAVGLLDLTGVHTLDNLVTMGHIRMVGTALVPEAFLARFTTLPIGSVGDLVPVPTPVGGKVKVRKGQIQMRVIAEALFPRLAERPWLGQKGFVGLTLWLGMVTSWLFITYGFVLFHGKGYDHPPVTYGIAPVLFALFLWLGLHRCRANASPAAEPGLTLRPAPRLWTLRLTAFAAAFVVLLNMFILRMFIPIALVPVGIVAVVDLLGVLVVRRWSKRPGWGACHRLALTSGVMGFFIVCSPLFEFVIPKKASLNMTGLTLVNLLALGGLIWLAWRTAQWETSRTVRR